MKAFGIILLIFAGVSLLTVFYNKDLVQKKDELEQYNHVRTAEYKQVMTEVNIHQAETLIIGSWRHKDGTTTFRPDGTCLIKMDNGTQIVREWRFVGKRFFQTNKRTKSQSGNWKPDSTHLVGDVIYLYDDIYAYQVGETTWGYKRIKTKKNDNGSVEYGQDGYNTVGLNMLGFNREGFDEEGYDYLGFDANNLDRDGYDREGYNQKGEDKQGRTRRSKADLQSYSYKPDSESNQTYQSNNRRKNDDVNSVPGISDSQLKKLCKEGCKALFHMGTTDYNSCMYCCTHDCL